MDQRAHPAAALTVFGLFDPPWLPRSPYNWVSHYGWRRKAEAEVRMRIQAVGGPPPLVREPDPQELRWRAEDEWLDRQWHWLDRGQP